MALSELPRGSKITTFKPPPEFDPLTADSRDLQRFGFPPRPDDPRHRARYEHVLRRLGGKLHYVVPTFQLNENVFHGPARPAITAGTETSGNWSGGVVFASSRQPFSWVQGDWVIPNFDAPDIFQPYLAGIWIGIDGGDLLSMDDVCQVGVSCVVFRTPISSFQAVYAWWEWWPEAEVAITNFPVGVGDMITIVLCADPANATAFLVNRTNGAVTSVGFTPPVGTTLVGTSAEWIVEALSTTRGQQLPLADYNQVFFTICEAFAGTLGGGGITVDGGTGNNINMVDTIGNVISAGTLISPTIIECQYV